MAQAPETPRPPGRIGGERRSVLRPADFTVRPMALSDLDAVLAVERRCFRDPWSRQSFAAEIDDPDRVHWSRVAVRGQRLAGYVVAWFSLDKAHLANVAVTPMYRGLGLGRHLVELAIGEVRGRGWRRVGLEVRASNDAAVGLYRRLGFRCTSRRRGYYREDREDALVFTLDLKRGT